MLFSFVKYVWSYPLTCFIKTIYALRNLKALLTIIANISKDCNGCSRHINYTPLLYQLSAVSGGILGLRMGMVLSASLLSLGMAAWNIALPTRQDWLVLL